MCSSGGAAVQLRSLDSPDSVRLFKILLTHTTQSRSLSSQPSITSLPTADLSSLPLSGLRWLRASSKHPLRNPNPPRLTLMHPSPSLSEPAGTHLMLTGEGEALCSTPICADIRICAAHTQFTQQGLHAAMSVLRLDTVLYYSRSKALSVSQSFVAIRCARLTFRSRNTV